MYLSFLIVLSSYLPPHFLIAVPVPVPVQENHVSEQSTPSAEEAVSGEVYNPSENGDVPITEEEEVPVAEVVDEVHDNAEPKVETPARVEAPKKSYASIVSVTISSCKKLANSYVQSSQLLTFLIVSCIIYCDPSLIYLGSIFFIPIT